MYTTPALLPLETSWKYRTSCTSGRDLFSCVGSSVIFRVGGVVVWLGGTTPIVLRGFFAARIAAKPKRSGFPPIPRTHPRAGRTCRPSDAVCLPEPSKSQGVIERYGRSAHRVRGSDGRRCRAARLRRASGIPICYTEKTRRPEHGTDLVEVPYGYALGGLPADG
jgi:hypothetical protein